MRVENYTKRTVYLAHAIFLTSKERVSRVVYIFEFEHETPFFIRTRDEKIKMKDLQEIKRLTVIDIVDNESDALSSPCSCMKPIPNASSDTPDDRSCTYTQELITVVREKKALDFNHICHAAHGLSLLLIAEYDEIGDDGNVETKSSHLLFDGGPDLNVWRSNVEKLNIDLSKIETAVLSHYHVDHSNGLRAAVEDISKARISKSGLDPLVVDLHKSQIVSRGLKVSGCIISTMRVSLKFQKYTTLTKKVNFALE